MLHGAPVDSKGNFNYVKFTRIIKHGKDDDWEITVNNSLNKELCFQFCIFHIWGHVFSAFLHLPLLGCSLAKTIFPYKWLIKALLSYFDFHSRHSIIITCCTYFYTLSAGADNVDRKCYYFVSDIDDFADPSNFPHLLFKFCLCVVLREVSWPWYARLVIPTVPNDQRVTRVPGLPTKGWRGGARAWGSFSSISPPPPQGVWYLRYQRTACSTREVKGKFFTTLSVSISNELISSFIKNFP